MIRLNEFETGYNKEQGTGNWELVTATSFQFLIIIRNWKLVTVIRSQFPILPSFTFIKSDHTIRNNELGTGIADQIPVPYSVHFHILKLTLIKIRNWKLVTVTSSQFPVPYSTQFQIDKV